MRTGEAAGGASIRLDGVFTPLAEALDLMRERRADEGLLRRVRRWTPWMAWVGVPGDAWGPVCFLQCGQLLEEAAFPVRLRFSDVTAWMCGGGSRTSGYERLLMLAVRDGILVENFRVSDPEERRLVEERLLPAMALVEQRLGLRPLVVRLYEPHEEDGPECWHYPGGLYEVARALLRGRDAGW